MSEDGEAFLARWSKRKLQARGVPEAKAEVSPEPAALAERPVDEEPEIPLEELPAIDSIDATTDLTPWLRKKVPEAWKQAALSRTWAADPAIRNFTGLIDYGWDWNVPGGVPGFGPLRASDNVAQLLAQAIGQVTQKPKPEPEPEPEAEAEAIVPGDAEKGASSPTDQPPAELPKDAPEVPVAAELPLIPAGETEMSSHDVGDDAPPPIRRRRGGGALPA